MNGKICGAEFILQNPTTPNVASGSDVVTHGTDSRQKLIREVVGGLNGPSQHGFGHRWAEFITEITRTFVVLIITNLHRSTTSEFLFNSSSSWKRFSASSWQEPSF